MATVDVYNLKREKVGTVDLADEVFAAEVKDLSEEHNFHLSFGGVRFHYDEHGFRVLLIVEAISNSLHILSGASIPNTSRARINCLRTTVAIAMSNARRTGSCSDKM